MRMILYNGSWFANVGEAFIDIGTHNLIRTVYPDVDIVDSSGIIDFYILNNFNWRSFPLLLKKKFWGKKLPKKYEDRIVDSSFLYKADYFVFAGPCLTKNLELRKSILTDAVKRGIKIIFLGVGGNDYDDEERESVLKVLEQLKPVLITTRDSVCYNLYKDYFPCINGIDNAYFVRKDNEDKSGFSINDYDVVTYCRSKEPIQFKEWNYQIIRPFHFNYSFSLWDMKESIFMSDCPYDYISLYANAHHIYTDMVHAAVVGSQYEIPVDLKKTDKRSSLFENIHGLRWEGATINLSYEKLKMQRIDYVEKIRDIVKREV